MSTLEERLATLEKAHEWELKARQLAIEAERERKAELRRLSRERCKKRKAREAAQAALQARLAALPPVSEAPPAPAAVFPPAPAREPPAPEPKAPRELTPHERQARELQVLLPGHAIHAEGLRPKPGHRFPGEMREDELAKYRGTPEHLWLEPEVV